MPYAPRMCEYCESRKPSGHSSPVPAAYVRYGPAASSRWCPALGFFVASGLAVAETLARRLQPRRRHGMACAKSVRRQKPSV